MSSRIIDYSVPLTDVRSLKDKPPLSTTHSHPTKHRVAARQYDTDKLKVRLLQVDRLDTSRKAVKLR